MSPQLSVEPSADPRTARVVSNPRGRKWRRQNEQKRYAKRQNDSPNCGGIFDVDVKRANLTTLEARMAEPGFWSDQHSAQAVVQQVKALKGWIDPFDKIEEIGRAHV